MKHFYPAILAVLILFFPAFSKAQQVEASLQTPSSKTQQSLQKQELVFEENKGQLVDENGNTASGILYYMKSNGMTVFFRKDGITYQWTYIDKLKSPKSNIISEATGDFMTPEFDRDLEKKELTTLHSFAATMTWQNHDSNVKVEPTERSEGVTNYYLAHCPEGITNVLSFKRVTYKNLYPGVDATYYIKDGKLKYDLVLHPGSDLNLIQMKYSDGINIKLDSGAIDISSPLGKIAEAEPISFLASGKIRKVSYKLNYQSNVISFLAEDQISYDEDFIIDPVVTWSTYYGGTGNDVGQSTAVNLSGYVFLAGYTTSTSIASGGYQNTIGGGTDAFIAKFGPNGDRVWATYYGGAGEDYGRSIAVDVSESIYLVGETSTSSGFSSVGFQNAHGGGTFDGFIAKFESSGTRLWTSYYGGPDEDKLKSVSVDISGNVYFAGETYSSGIASGGDQNTNGGTNDALLAKFSPSGSRLWATYFGGIGFERGTSVAVDGNDVYLTGTTNTTGLLSGGHQSTFGGVIDAFLIKYDNTGTKLWSTYYGGSSEDYGQCVTIDKSGNVILAGFSNSVAGVSTFNSHSGSGYDSFCAKFSSSGVRQWGRYLGSDELYSVATDGFDNIYIPSNTHATSSSYDFWYTVCWKLNPSGASWQNNTYMTTQYNIGDVKTYSIVVDAYGSVFCAGTTNSSYLTTQISGLQYSPTGLPNPISGYQSNTNGGDEGFLTKIKFENWEYLQDYTNAFAIDGSGNIYVISKANSATPSSPTVHQLSYGGGSSDCFLTKLNSFGQVQWATYYGGSGTDDATAVWTDASGNVYMVGSTTSTSGIASSGHDMSYSSLNDAFIVKFNSSGIRQWATYYGSSGDDIATGVVVDQSGNVYVSGQTTSSSNIASNGHDNSLGGSEDAFLVKFNSSGVRQWGTYYGGSGNDIGSGLAIDVSGNIFLAGNTNSSTNIASGGFQNSLGGGKDIFIAKFNASGVRQSGTYYGGSGDETSCALKLDGGGNIYASCKTTSMTAVAYNGYKNTHSGGSSEVLLVKFSSLGVREWATYYGGTGDDYPGKSLGFDASGNVYIVGSTSSPENIASDNSFQLLGDDYDLFIAKFNPAGNLLGGTYFGSPLYGPVGDDYGIFIDIAQTNNIIVGYNTAYSGIASLGNFNSTPPIEPTAQPSDFAITNIGTSSFDVSYSIPTSLQESYLVVRKAGSTPSSDPLDGTAYTLNQSLGDGAIVYVGTDSSFSQVGLSQGTAYYYKVYAFNPITLNYLTTLPLSGNATTLVMATEPTAQPTGIMFTKITDTNIWFTFTAATGSPSGYLVLESIYVAPDTAPTDGTNYSVGQFIGSGKVVQMSSSISVKNNGLYPGNDYYYTVYSYNGSGLTANYLTASPLAGMASTTCSSPPCPVALTTVNSDELEEISGGLKIYPNPANDRLKVELGNEAAFLQADFISPLGEVLSSTEVRKSFEVYVKNLPEGIYFLRLKSKSKFMVVKVQVAH